MADEQVKLTLQVDQTGNAGSKLRDTAAAAEKMGGAVEKAAKRGMSAEEKFESAVRKTVSQMEKKEKKAAYKGAVTAEAEKRRGGNSAVFEKMDPKAPLPKKEPVKGGGDGKDGKAKGGAGGGIGGAAGSLGGLVSKFNALSGAVVAVMEGLGKVGDGLNILNNASLTAAQKNSALAEAFIPGVKAYKRFVEAIDGTTEKMRRNLEVFADRNLLQRINQENQFRMEGLRTQSGNAQAGVAAARDNRITAARVFDRNTYSGQIQTENEARLQPAREALARARAQAQSSRAAVNSAGTNVNSGEGDMEFRRRTLAAAQARADDLRRRENVSGVRRRADRDTAMRDTDSQQQGYLASLAQQEQRINDLRQRRIELAQSESNVRRASLDIARAELENLRAQEQRMTSNRERLGSLNRGQRESARSAARFIQRNGLDNASSEMIQAAEQIVPQMIARLRRERGDRDIASYANEFNDPRDDFAEEQNGRTLQQVREAVNASAANVAVQVNLDTEALATQIAVAMREVLEPILRIGQERARVEVQRQQIGRQIAQNAAQ